MQGGLPTGEKLCPRAAPAPGSGGPPVHAQPAPAQQGKQTMYPPGQAFCGPAASADPAPAITAALMTVAAKLGRMESEGHSDIYQQWEQFSLQYQGVGNIGQQWQQFEKEYHEKQAAAAAAKPADSAKGPEEATGKQKGQWQDWEEAPAAGTGSSSSHCHWEPTAKQYGQKRWGAEEAEASGKGHDQSGGEADLPWWKKNQGNQKIGKGGYNQKVGKGGGYNGKDIWGGRSSGGHWHNGGGKKRWESDIKEAKTPTHSQTNLPPQTTTIINLGFEGFFFVSILWSPRKKMPGDSPPRKPTMMASLSGRGGRTTSGSSPPRKPTRMMASLSGRRGGRIINEEL